MTCSFKKHNWPTLGMQESKHWNAELVWSKCWEGMLCWVDLKSSIVSADVLKLRSSRYVLYSHLVELPSPLWLKAPQMKQPGLGGHCVRDWLPAPIRWACSMCQYCKTWPWVGQSAKWNVWQSETKFRMNERHRIYKQIKMMTGCLKLASLQLPRPFATITGPCHSPRKLRLTDLHICCSPSHSLVHRGW